MRILRAEKAAAQLFFGQVADARVFGQTGGENNSAPGGNPVDHTAGVQPPGRVRVCRCRQKNTRLVQ